MDGYALMRKIRKLQGRSPGGQIPVIALAAYAGGVDQQPAIIAAGFLASPT
jgi:CheY-like chemotaxis protein